MILRALISSFLIVASVLLNLASAGSAGTAEDEVQVLADVSFTEGPTVDAEGNVYFTDLRSHRIYKYTHGKGVTTFREESNGANGMVFDDQGRLIVCESGEKPRITRTDIETGKIEILAEGGELKAPNDVTFDGKGRIYFTDPEGKAIYRIDPDGRLSRILSAPLLELPNGIIISPDDKTLYYVESNMLKEGGARMIRAFDLADDGTVSNMRVFHNFYPGRSADGISVDSKGNIYAAAGLNRTRGTYETLDTKPGIHVFSPEGDLLKYYPISEDTVTNCAFGGADMKTLYVTAGKTLFSIRVDTEGTRR